MFLGKWKRNKGKRERRKDGEEGGQEECLVSLGVAGGTAGSVPRMKDSEMSK